MTSCLLVKAPDQILAVADGRLSLADDTVSFDTTEKIRQFTPKYSIPRVSMGQFNHYFEFNARDWYLAYAGTYALASVIADLFIKNISGGLYLGRGQGGVPRFEYEFDERGSFDDSYNFRHEELLAITPRVIVEELRNAAQVRCDEWSRRRGRPDCEFLLFGEHSETKKYSAFRLAPDSAGWSPGAQVRLQVEAVADGTVASIGSVDVASATYGDQQLQTGIEGWGADQTDVALHNLFAGPELRGVAGGSNQRDLMPELPEERNWGLDRVRRRFIDILRGTADKSVGGDFTLVSGIGWGMTLSTLQAE